MKKIVLAGSHFRVQEGFNVNTLRIPTTVSRAIHEPKGLSAQLNS
jgi:hypothetical protein